jgi:predicted transcriptional regulator of viral defense system
MTVDERRAIKWARRQGVFRNKAAKKAGIYSRTLTSLTEGGKLERLSRGSYRFKSNDQLSDPDLVTVALAVPNAVICLVSALSFHRLTTQIPHEVSFALPEKSRSPRLSYPLIKVHRFRGKAYEEGIETHKIDNVMVKIYNPEKTLADIFKFRNKIGLDIFLEALKMYRSRKRINTALMLKYARICRVEKQIRPYLEAVV